MARSHGFARIPGPGIQDSHPAPPFGALHSNLTEGEKYGEKVEIAHGMRFKLLLVTIFIISDWVESVYIKVNYYSKKLFKIFLTFYHLYIFKIK